MIARVRYGYSGQKKLTINPGSDEYETNSYDPGRVRRYRRLQAAKKKTKTVRTSSRPRCPSTTVNNEDAAESNDARVQKRPTMTISRRIDLLLALGMLVGLICLIIVMSVVGFRVVHQQTRCTVKHTAALEGTFCPPCNKKDHPENNLPSEADQHEDGNSEGNGDDNDNQDDNQTRDRKRGSGGRHTGGTCVTTTCAQVFVKYVRKTDKSKETWEGILQTSEPNEKSMGHKSKCSYSSCDQSNQENEQNVNEWLAGYVAKQESGEEFDCYYNPEEPEKVYVGKVYSETEVVNAVLWPALFTVVCLLALVGRRIYFKCIKKQTAPREMPYTVSAPQTKPDQTQDPEKNPTQLGAEAGSQAAGPVAAAPPLELKAPPEYSEIVEASGGRPVAFILPPTYSEANLHKAAKEPLPPCDA